MFVGLVTETDTVPIRSDHTMARTKYVRARKRLHHQSSPTREGRVWSGTATPANCNPWPEKMYHPTRGGVRGGRDRIYSFSSLSSCSFFLQPNCLLFCCLGFSEHEMRFVWPNINPWDAYVVSICVFLLPDLCWLVKMLRPYSADVRD